MASSFPTPFWTLATAPCEKAWAVAEIALSVCIAFVATMPKSQSGSSRRIRRGAQPRRDLAGAGEREPVLLDHLHMGTIEVVRPDLDVVELREVRGEE